jgi:16S rRNA (adenine1518-N6/adenine1519-N6)-dimethyltransferase
MMNPLGPPPPAVVHPDPRPVTAARISTPSYVSGLVRSGLVRPKRRLGQTFLVDRNVLDHLVRVVDPAGLAVVEIGAGLGGFTLALAEAGAARVVAVEKDRTLAALLAENVAGRPEISVHVGDALAEDLRELGLEAARAAPVGATAQAAPVGATAQAAPVGATAQAAPVGATAQATPVGVGAQAASLRPGPEPIIAGNLPYSITSPLLFKLLEAPLFWSRAVVMVQLEVAERILAAPGGKNYGALTLAVAAVAEAALAFRVGRGSFYPAPAVDTAVLTLRRRIAPAGGLDSAGLARLARLVRAAFGQRRKMLANSLAAGLGLPRAEVANLARGAGVAPERRAETLSLAEFLTLEVTLRGRLV